MEWQLSVKSRVKYVDDATAMEIIPWCSPPYLPFTVTDIYTYASLTGINLNSKKCKEMIINSMQYSPFPLPPLPLGVLLLKGLLPISSWVSISLMIFHGMAT